MEAVSFQHYLHTQHLITPTAAAAKLPAAVVLSEDDYLLGLFDLVGELMRFAITSMATTGEVPSGASSASPSLSPSVSSQDPKQGTRDIVTDLRCLRTHFEALNTTGAAGGGAALGREVEKKMGVMKTCVEKVENAVYGMIVRGRERPKGWVPELREEGGGREGVESY